MGPRFQVLALLVLGAFLFALNAGGYALWPADEPRFAEVAREMLLQRDFLVPRVNGEVYLEKPPLLFWSTAALSLPAGAVNEWTARLPSMLSALAVLLLTYGIARELYDRRVALWATIILMTCVRFWWQARTGQIDMLLAACLMLSIFALLRWHRTQQTRFLLALYLGMGLGLLAKGPPALVFPLLLIFAFYWGRRDLRRRTHWVIGSLAAIAMVSCWFVPARLAAAAGSAAVEVESGIGGNLFRNTLGRFLLGVSKAQPPWYYLESIPVDLFPWTLFLPWTLWWTWKHRRGSESMRFLLAWTVPALLFFSISIGKRAIYILPLFPAFAILLALAILALAGGGHPRGLRWIRGLWGGLLMLLGAALCALPYSPYHAVFTPGMIALAVLLPAMGLTALLAPASIHSLIAGQFTLLLACAASVVLPAVDTFKSAKDITAPVRALSRAGADFDLYSAGFSSEEYIFYSEHFHTSVLTSLIGVENVPQEQLIEIARQQKDARKRIVKAVESIPLDNLARISPDERAALRKAIDDAVDDAGKELETTRSFEQALIQELDGFFGKFAGPRPAFLFVQEEDWRWMVPLLSAQPPIHMLHHEIVGSREVLLFANEAGLRATQAQQSAPG